MYQRVYSEVHFLAQEGDMQWNATTVVDRGQIVKRRSRYQLLPAVSEVYSVFLAILLEDML